MFFGSYWMLASLVNLNVFAKLFYNSTKDFWLDIYEGTSVLYDENLNDS